MAAKTVQNIIADIDAYMTSHGLPASRWYVGITADIDKRLFGDHNVLRNGPNGPRAIWIWREALTHLGARTVETAYHDVGCAGGPGGGDRNSVFVYAYAITATTVE
jgi:hypothetical protein